MSRKKPCCICRRWYLPDVRVGNRQRTCGRPECREVHQKKRQASWRARNPDYFIARRIQLRAASSQKPEPLRLCLPLINLPWDIAHDEFGTKGADFIGTMGKLLLQAVKTQLNRQNVDSTMDTGTLSLPVPKSEFRTQYIDSA